jgi:ATP diphosphatase
MGSRRLRRSGQSGSHVAPGPDGTIVGIGPGDPDAIPAHALRAAHEAERLHGVDLSEELIAALGRPVAPHAAGAALPTGGVVLAIDPVALRLARAHPRATTSPDRTALRARAIGSRVAALAEVAERLRRDCPWDRRQTLESIVPHTIEEAFEVAEAVSGGAPERIADEIGDLLFQAVFLAGLLEETDGLDLGVVAGLQADKLVSRHPHVYGDEIARDAAGVIDIWERRKREERGGQGIFHDLPAGLPALAYATKAQRRAGAVGFRFGAVEDALGKLVEEVAELRTEPSGEELGDVLFACVAVARELDVDPELALRASARRFRGRVERAAELAGEAGEDFERLAPGAQLAWYERAHGAEPDEDPGP